LLIYDILDLHSSSIIELVCPVYSGNALIGIIDIDSPHKSAFSALDLAFFASVASLLVSRSSNARVGSQKHELVAVPVDEATAEMIRDGEVACSG
jgi:hypothetical protein